MSTSPTLAPGGSTPASPPQEGSTPAPSQSIAQRLKGLMGESLTIVILTALSYLGAYSFKLARYETFGIPDSLVSIGLTDCLNAALHGLISSTLLIAFGYFMLAMSEAKEVSRPIRATMMAAIAVTGLYIVGSTTLGLQLPQACTLLWNLLMYVIFPIFVIRFFRIALSDENPARMVKGLFSRQTLHALGRDFQFTSFSSRMLLLATFAYSLWFTVIHFSITRAKKETKFQQIAGTNHIVIDFLDDHLLCKTLDESSRKFLPGFTLVRQQDDHDMTLTPVTLDSPLPSKDTTQPTGATPTPQPSAITPAGDAAPATST